jgi:hypothetical protein
MTPSASIIASAMAPQTVVDAAGRRLGLRQLTALDKLRLFKAAGPILSQNQPWLGMAVLACSVIAIDDVPVPIPTNESQIEATVSRLGDVGISAVAIALQENVEAEPDELVANAGN